MSTEHLQNLYWLAACLCAVGFLFRWLFWVRLGAVIGVLTLAYALIYHR